MNIRGVARAARWRQRAWVGVDGGWQCVGTAEGGEERAWCGCNGRDEREQKRTASLRPTLRPRRQRPSCSWQHRCGSRSWHGAAHRRGGACGPCPSLAKANGSVSDEPQQRQTTWQTRTLSPLGLLAPLVRADLGRRVAARGAGCGASVSQQVPTAASARVYVLLCWRWNERLLQRRHRVCVFVLVDKGQLHACKVDATRVTILRSCLLAATLSSDEGARRPTSRRAATGAPPACHWVARRATADAVHRLPALPVSKCKLAQRKRRGAVASECSRATQTQSSQTAQHRLRPSGPAPILAGGCYLETISRASCSVVA